ncbi:MAG: ASCH domain-containing protein [Propionibacteriaceae bacterium]|nr:ASCH domain-containing protein [Propionibacteriaceae bacterium]
MDEEQDLDGRLQDFWTVALKHAKIGDLDVVLGRQWGEALAPPAWSFGESPEEADAWVALVLEGRVTATSGLLDDLTAGGASLPQKGDLSVILDGTGTPRALIRDAEVTVLPFAQVTADQADAEGEGGLDHWRASHREVWEAAGYTVDDSTSVVWEPFTVLYPPMGRPRGGGSDPRP